MSSGVKWTVAVRRLSFAAALTLIAIPPATVGCTKHECDAGQSRCNADGTFSVCDAYANCGDSGFICDSIWEAPQACGDGLTCREPSSDYVACLQPDAKLTCDASYLPLAGGHDGVVGDFNGDGKLDVAEVGTKLQVAVGKGDGTFAAASSASDLTTGEASSSAVVAGDFDGDGHLDVALLEPSQTGGESPGIHVYLGDGAGGFARSMATAASASAVVAGDLNHDGKTDLVLDASTVLLATTNGNFNSVTLAAPSSTSTTYRSLLADVDGDRDLDLVALVATYATSTTSATVAWGLGDGTFEPAVVLPVSGALPPSQLAVGDFDGDGVTDLALLDVDTVYLASGKPPRSFGALAPAFKTPLRESMLTGDIDGDGRVDFLLATNGAAAVLLNQGGGSFAPPFDFAPTHVAADLRVLADVNADGRADAIFAVAEKYGAGQRVLLGSCR